MSLATLLTPPPNDRRARALWEHDHDIAHRNFYATWAPKRFSNLTSILDPMLPKYPTPADEWNLDHQRAQDDFAQAGVRINGTLVDSDLRRSEDRTWWTFVNHQEHYQANQTIPTPST